MLILYQTDYCCYFSLEKMDFMTSKQETTSGQNNVDQMDITSLFNYLWFTLKKNDKEMKDWFYARGFILTTLSNNPTAPIYLTHYLNHTQLWIPPWAREGRGTILFLSKQSNRWEILKYNFPRGAEVLTQIHTDAGVNCTDDVSTTNFQMFDKNQQDFMNRLLNPAATLNAVASNKVDGMLLCISLYTGERAEIAKAKVMNGNNKFAQMIIRAAEDRLCPYTVVLSTQKTFDISDNRCLSYIVTALIVSMGILSYDRLCQLVQNKQLTPLDVFKKYGVNTLLDKLNVFFNNAHKSPALTLCCEVVCPLRTCAWNFLHHELAISYPNAIVNVLSYADINKNSIPHFMFSSLIHEMGFDVPLYWYVGSTQQCYDLIQDLTAVILGKMTDIQYLKKHHPSNKYTVINSCLHFEGFVLWNPVMDKWDYHKLKSVPYYDAHNPKNVRGLLEIARHTIVFPSATLIARIFYNFYRQLWQLYNEFRTILGYNSDNMTVHAQLVSGLKKTAQDAYNNPKMPHEKKFRMLAQSSNWEKICRSTVCQVFGQGKYDWNKVFNHTDVVWNKELFTVVQNIIHALAPWNATDKKKYIMTMVDTPDPLLEKFYLLISQLQPPATIQTVKITKFWIQGCYTSRDIDVLVLAEKKEEVHKDAMIDIGYLKTELADLGYDVTRSIDFNVVWIENGELLVSSKGGQMTSNILYMTYHLHKQKYPCPFTKLVSLDQKDQIRATSKFIMDNLSELISRASYQQFRIERVKAYEGQWRRVHFAIEVVGHIQKLDNDIWRDLMKSLTMKIIQMMLLEENIQEYTKPGLAAHLNRRYPGHEDGALWLLMRGTRGTCNDETLQLLKDEFVRIASSVLIKDWQWQNIPMSLDTNPTKLPDRLYNEFIKSPLQPSTVFETEFQILCQQPVNIGSFFPLPCKNVDQLPTSVRSHVLAIDQRTDEWKKLLSFYTCGNNNGVQECQTAEWVKFYYHLIRGCIVEIIAMNNCDFSSLFPGQKITKITIGFLVQEVGKKGSPACAPDLLLVLDDKEVVPVEIKCLHGPNVDNHDFRRGVNLAQRQLDSVIDIIGDKNVCYRGIILIVNVHNNNFSVKATVVNF